VLYGVDEGGGLGVERLLLERKVFLSRSVDLGFSSFGAFVG
jgi:hypothetical protein